MGCDFALSAIVGIWTWTWSLVNEPAGYVCEENCDDDKNIWYAGVASFDRPMSLKDTEGLRLITPSSRRSSNGGRKRSSWSLMPFFESLDLTRCNGSSMCLFSLRAVTFASHWAPWCIIGKYGHSHPEIKIYILSCLSLTQKQTHNLLAPLKCS